MMNDIKNFVYVSDKLATGGQPTENQLREIAKAGYEVVINLGLTGTNYALPDESGLVELLGLKYVHVPVQWESPSKKALQQFIMRMEQLKGRNVFVHCAANYRVSCFLAIYRVAKLGWSKEEAMSELSRLWEPNEIWTSFIDNAIAKSGTDN
jgi:protein tyrosine phosphatase (PTP) superfamily phosphohydrolase (DUF442 family)